MFGEGFDATGQAAVGEDGWIHVAYERPHFVQGNADLVPRAGQDLPGARGFVREFEVEEPEQHVDGHQTRLRAVVQVALDSAQFSGLHLQCTGPGFRQHRDALVQAVALRAAAQPSVDVSVPAWKAMAGGYGDHSDGKT